MRTLAVDPGTRRVGLALSDSAGKLATPHSVLNVSSMQMAVDEIVKVARREEVQRLVIGFPLNMDGSMSAGARQSIEMGKHLATALSLTVIYVDERLSSFAAEQSVIDRKRAGEKITRKAKKSQLDALAASAFLQEFLDGKLPPLDV